MKKYLLLRDNKESGPYSFGEITLNGLKTYDLIWIEGQSSEWKYPAEIDELKNFVRDEQASFIKEKNVFVSLPSNFSLKKKKEVDESYLYPVNEAEPVLETSYVKPLEELKENYSSYQQNKPNRKRRLFHSNVGNVTAVFIGVMLSAFIVKKMVDDSIAAPSEESIAAIPIIDHEPPADNSESYKNAIVTEIVPVFKSNKKTVVKHKDIKKQLSVKNNQYKVGLFGGINGLQLTVFNASPHFVDKVIVTVDFLRPNGEVVQSENVMFSAIKSKDAQTIAIPGTNRGVKVRYRILKVYSHEYEVAQREA